MIFTIISNIEYLASLIVFTFAVEVFISLLQRNSKHSPDQDTECDSDTLPTDKPSIIKKLRKKSTKKKKTRVNNSAPPIHSQNMAGKIESQPKPPEEPEAHRVKKKHRTKTIAEVCSSQNKSVKFYSPLSLFVKLQLDPVELYDRFLPYMLMYHQLIDNGFPFDSPDGKVCFKKSRFCVELDNPNQRLCTRCNEKFSVSDDGLYQAETVCIYHSGKRLSVGGISGAGAFSCCGSYLPQGCTTGKQHVSASISVTDAKFVKTREKRLKQPYDLIYALDCEMCYTIHGLEVARVSVVGTDGLTVYDSYVLPENPVIDYNTMYSGITANDLKNVTTTLVDVQAFLLKLLNARTILVGHGLENDLRALRLIHPTVVDTSVVFPHSNGYPLKRSLKSLATSYLKQTIQQSECGHDSVEDARTCIELMLWKIETDDVRYSERQQLQSTGIPTLGFSPPQPWSVSALSINPVLVPCNIGCWVPPVGSHLDYC